MSAEEERIKNDMVLYARTGKTEKLVQCIELLEGEVDFRWGDFSPLGHAAVMGRPSAVAVLLSHGAGVSTPGAWGQTPLMLAATRGCLASVRLLLSAGADSNLKDFGGRSALDHARGANATEVVALLSQTTSDPWKGADLDWLASYDEQLALAIVRFIQQAISSGEGAAIQPRLEGPGLPDWYSRLIASVPLAGISFCASPPSRDYDEDGKFLKVEELRKIPMEGPFLIEPFAHHCLVPIAEGSDGNRWMIKALGDHKSPVFVWDLSGMEPVHAYDSFLAFLNALKP